MTSSKHPVNWLHWNTGPIYKKLLICISYQVSMVTIQTFSQPGLSGKTLQTWDLNPPKSYWRMRFAILHYLELRISNKSLLVPKSLDMASSRYKLRMGTGPCVSAGLSLASANGLLQDAYDLDTSQPRAFCLLYPAVSPGETREDTASCFPYQVVGNFSNSKGLSPLLADDCNNLNGVY